MEHVLFTDATKMRMRASMNLSLKVLSPIFVFLDTSYHRAIDQPTIKAGETRSVFFVFAATRCRRSIGQPCSSHITDVSAIALALPIVLLVFGISKLQNLKPAKLLAC